MLRAFDKKRYIHIENVELKLDLIINHGHHPAIDRSKCSSPDADQRCKPEEFNSLLIQRLLLYHRLRRSQSFNYEVRIEDLTASEGTRYSFDRGDHIRVQRNQITPKLVSYYGGSRDLEKAICI